MSGWSEDEDAILRRQIGERLSAAQIGASLGRSRNAVIGRAHRLGLRLDGTPKPHGRDPAPKINPKAPRVNVERMEAARIRASMPVLAPDPDFVPDEKTAVPFIEARALQCRYWLSDSHHYAAPVCGEKTRAGTSYCAHHYKLIYTGRGEFCRNPYNCESMGPGLCRGCAASMRMKARRSALNPGVPA